MIAFPDPEQRVQEYIDGVLSGDIVAGRLIRLAVQRHVQDLGNCQERGFKFDRDIATRACAFFPAVCHHSLGEWDGHRFELSGWQLFCVWVVFGWRRIDDGSRRFRKAYISVARKNGKTTMIAAVALLLMFFDEPFEPGAQIFCAATKEKQAKIMYDEAVRIVKRSPSLKARCRVRKAPHGIHWEQHDSSFQPIGSDSEGTDGLNPHAVLKDELHEWRERHRALKEKLETGGGARRQPLDVTITTAGTDHSEIWKEENGYSVSCLESVITGIIIDDTRFVFIACIDDEDDPFDESCWPKANPNWEISVKPQSVRDIANEAKHSPTALNKLIRYHCNRQVGSTERALPVDVWMAGAKELTITDGATGHGGMDLGRSNDWAAIAASFPIYGEVQEEVDGRVQSVTRVIRHEVISKAWCARDGDFKIDREPFRTWIGKGLLTAHDGDQIDFTEIEDEILRWHSKYQLATWAFDPAFARLMADRLQNVHGLTVFSFTQTERHYNEPCVRFHDDMKAGKIWHANEPVLSWQATNLKYARNHKGLVMPDKSGREFKIDGMVACIMAFSECMFSEHRELCSGSLFLTP